MSCAHEHWNEGGHVEGPPSESDMAHEHPEGAQGRVSITHGHCLKHRSCWHCVDTMWCRCDTDGPLGWVGSFPHSGRYHG